MNTCLIKNTLKLPKNGCRELIFIKVTKVLKNFQKYCFTFVSKSV